MIPFRDSEDGLPSHLDRLVRVPLLSAQDEMALARRVVQGDREAKERLIESNMRLVIGIARSYKTRQIALEDLIQEGAIGLVQASERFDPERGFRFSTYATHWIRQAISRAIDNKGKAIRLPAHVSVTLRRIERVRIGLVSVSGREPTTEELAVAMAISPRKLQTLLDASHELISLDAPVGENHSATVGSLITDSGGINAEEVVLTNEVLAELGAILRELNEREQRVMNFKYRLDGGVPAQPINLEHELQVTRDRLRQIEARAIGKLRVIVQTRRLGELFGRDIPSTTELE